MTHSSASAPTTPEDTSTPLPALQVWPVLGVTEIREGEDLAAALVAAWQKSAPTPCDGDVLVVTSNVVSTVLGLRAAAAERHALVLREAEHVVAERTTPGGITRIVRTHAGPTLAGAGIDVADVTADDRGQDDNEHHGDQLRPDEATVLLLPRKPHEVAAQLLADVRAHLGTDASRLGLVVSDRSARPWRSGATAYALGVAGISALDDPKGLADGPADAPTDDPGAPFSPTVRAVADELASAADLVTGTLRGVPAAVVRGVDVPGAAEPSAAALTRAVTDDWFRLGSREAVMAALGAPPGSPQAVEVGLPPADGATTGAEREAAVERACRAAALPDAYPVLPEGHPFARRSTAIPLTGVVTNMLQYGVRVEAPDEYTLGLAVARLIVALAAEGIPAATGPREAPPPWAPHSSGASAVATTVVFA